MPGPNARLVSAAGASIHKSAISDSDPQLTALKALAQRIEQSQGKPTDTIWTEVPKAIKPTFTSVSPANQSTSPMKVDDSNTLADLANKIAAVSFSLHTLLEGLNP